MLINLQNVSLAFGYNKLLDNVSFHIGFKQRIAILGRNGAGKSSLLKLINQEIKPDDGTITFLANIKVAKLTQELQTQSSLTVREVLESFVKTQIDLLKNFEHQAESNQDTTKLQNLIESQNAWNINCEIDRTLQKLNIDPNEPISALSGGNQRNVLFEAVLLAKPDVLLLDEPTNHLDIEAIDRLEEQIKKFEGTSIVITHDRKFLQNIATEIIEIDRGNVIYWRGDYETFLKHKEETLKAEEISNNLFDKKLAIEEAWIREGIKARRTRNEGRVRALKKMREEYKNRKTLQGNIKIESQNFKQSGKNVAVFENVNFEYNNKSIINDFSFILEKGAKIGIIGNNGTGKSTLIKLLTGDIKPTSGNVYAGTNLKIAYFDQMQESLNLSQNVLDNLAEGRNFITVNGKEKHIYSYLEDFLFNAERARSPVASLSGGERARLCFAKLFSKEANLIVLDEPTNDLDIETLEFIEQTLSEYKGTLIAVSHDREFLDNISSSLFVFEDGTINEYIGGYSDYLIQRKKNKQPDVKQKNLATKKNEVKNKNKLTFNLQQELLRLPTQIDTIEAEIRQIEQVISAADFFNKSKQEVDSTLTALTVKQHELETLLARYIELDG